MAITQCTEALAVADRTTGGVTEYDFTLAARPGETAPELAARLVSALRDYDAVLLRAHAFGALRHAAPLRQALGAALGDQAGPVTFVDGHGFRGNDLAGVQAVALSGAPVEWIEFGGRRAGAKYEDSQAMYLLLGDLTSNCLTDSPHDQTFRVFEQLEAALAQAGFALSELVRTWLFANDILAWYGDLNRARTSFFESRELFGKFVPASTGVGVANDHPGAAMVAEAVAMKPKRAGVAAKPVASPLQNAALNYGSAFSRAAGIWAGGRERVLVSGTASIAKSGETMHVGDVALQVEQTMAVVEAMLLSECLTWDQVCRAVVYVVDDAGRAAYDAYCAQHQVPSFPALTARADICRDDLLFEIELDGVSD